MESSKFGSASAVAVAEPVSSVPTCSHQWMIEAPSGPSSSGRCRRCGEVKQFMNYIEGSAWGYDISIEQLAGSARLPGSRDPKPKKSLAEDE